MFEEANRHLQKFWKLSWTWLMWHIVSGYDCDIRRSQYLAWPVSWEPQTCNAVSCVTMPIIHNDAVHQEGPVLGGGHNGLISRPICPPPPSCPSPDIIWLLPHLVVSSALIWHVQPSPPWHLTSDDQAYLPMLLFALCTWLDYQTAAVADVFWQMTM